MRNRIYRVTRGPGGTILALLLSPLCMLAQDTIRANPNAVPLRRIWGMRGGFGDGVGNIVAALPDLNGDGRNEFAVASGGDRQWRVYSMDANGDADVVWMHSAVSPEPIAAGRFHGGNRWTLVKPRRQDTIGRSNYFYELFGVQDGRIADSPHAEWSSYMAPDYLVGPRRHIVDLDLDGDDELIIAAPVSFRDGEVIENGEIWIYAGSPDFQIDTPTVVIRDDKRLGRNYALHIGRLDADEYPDLIAISDNGGRIRWGGAELRALDRPIDREFEIAGQLLTLLDADGVGIMDFLWNSATMHLSSNGKDPHSRPFGLADADRRFVGRGTAAFALGPLNDTAGRFDMFGLNTGTLDDVELVFSGGIEGPDEWYDATYSAEADGLGFTRILRHSRPAGDVDGNGWRDAIGGDNDANGGGGAAVVLGGGPYIPRDAMPSSAIRDIAIDGRQAAINVWPMPASDVVHVAWRGDLARTPASFAVHDILGRLVARGDADALRGEVVWRCGEQPSGAYLLTVFDRPRSVIATVPSAKW